LSGNVLIPFEYDNIWKMDNGNYYYMWRDKKIGIRTREKELLPCKFAYLRSIGANLFVVGSSDSRTNSGNSYTGLNFGIVTIKGDTLVPCRFNVVTIPSGFSYVKNKSEPYGVVNAGGPQLISVCLGDSTGLYTFEGKCILAPKYKLVAVPRLNAYGQIYFNYNESVADRYHLNSTLFFTEKGKYGVVAPGKGLIQAAVFDAVVMEMATNKRPAFYRVQRNGKWGLLNEDGSERLACNYATIQFYTQNIFVAEKEAKLKEYDWRSDKVKPRVYQKIFPAYNSYIDLVSGAEFYSNREDSVIHRCTVLARLPGDVVMINPADAVEGRGKNAKRVEVNWVSLTTSYYFSVQTKKGKLLCNRDYKIIIPPGAYKSFHNVDEAHSFVVITNGGKAGMMDSTGKLVVDTVFEAIGTKQVNGMIFVKPWKPHDSLVSGHCAEGWALADTLGRLLTEPNLSTTELSEYEPRQFLVTKDGIGVFDIYQRKFITPPRYINGIFTGDGGWILQTQDSLFMPFSFDGKPMSDKSWKGLLHVAGTNEIDHSSASFASAEGIAAPDSTKL